MIGMDAPCHTDESEQDNDQVMFVVFDVVKYECGAFAEQIPTQRKDNSP